MIPTAAQIGHDQIGIAGHDLGITGHTLLGMGGHDGSEYAWSERTDGFSLKPVGVRSATSGSIHFDRPRLEDDEHLVVDLHSHGRSGAFFSATDDEDDRGEVKVSVVLGHCDQDAFSTAMRLCLLGKFIALELASVSNGAITFKEKMMSRQASSGRA